MHIVVINSSAVKREKCYITKVSKTLMSQNIKIFRKRHLQENISLNIEQMPPYCSYLLKQQKKTEANYFLSYRQMQVGYLSVTIISK